ncbi:hypothetical protein ACHAXT_010887 [Thalassiosira profunda]
MQRFSTALALLALAPAATAFCPTAPRRSAAATTRLFATEGTDFDAPVPADPQSGTAVLDSLPVVDDECYMGKDADFLDCVDFDPPRTTRSANAQDQPRTPPRWTFADDFDAPVPNDPQRGTAVLGREPVVDDECYTGKDGGATECVDFDPPHTFRENDWTNAADAPDPRRLGPRKGLSKLL